MLEHVNSYYKFLFSKSLYTVTSFHFEEDIKGLQDME